MVLILILILEYASLCVTKRPHVMVLTCFRVLTNVVVLTHVMLLTCVMLVTHVLVLTRVMVLDRVLLAQCQRHQARSQADPNKGLKFKHYHEEPFQELETS